MPITLGQVEDSSEFRRRQYAIMISRNIVHDLWMSADSAGKRHLYADGLRAGIHSLNSAEVADGDVISMCGAMEIAVHDRRYSQP
jgi:hypothetical protein